MTEPEAPPPTTASRAWLVPMLGLVAAALVALEWVYQRYPVPPGVDPGDWIQRSYAWVGLPALPFDAVGSPYLYPPLMFPVLGALVRITGSPLATGFVFGGLLLVLFGLTTIHLARRFFGPGPVQLLVVGLAVLNGTTLSILFWGGYPNFLAFSVFNEALIFLLAFVRTRATVAGVAFWSWAAVLYLTHTLTFLILAGATGVAGLLFLLEDPKFIRILWSRGTLIGAPILGATIVVYSLLIRFFHIQTPGYLGSNPTAYTLENLGQLFRPLGSAPVFWVSGPSVGLASSTVLALLLGLAAAVAAVLVLLDRLAHRRDARWTLAAGFLIATLLVPALGWLAHVDTDYTRFVYFFPFPVALAIGLIVEPIVLRWMRAATPPRLPAEDPTDPSPGATPRGFGRLSAAGREFSVAVAVVVVLGLLAAAVSGPALSENEQLNANTAHDAPFLAALHYISTSPQAGSVLTLQSSVRWTEAVTSRGAFDIGPTWLLFEPWQIVNAQETYWALNARYVLTNNYDALAFSGGYQGVDTEPYSAAPLYAVYDEGVTIPMVNLQTAGVLVNATVGNVTKVYSAGQWGPPSLSLLPSDGAGGTSILLTFSGPLFNVTVSGSVRSGAAAGALENISVVPAPGVVVRSVQLALTPPSTSDSLLHPAQSAGVIATPTGLEWSGNYTIGPAPGPTSLTTEIALSPHPSAEAIAAAGSPNSAALEFRPPASGWTNISLAFTTTGTDGNPAVQLPGLLNTTAFLALHDIHFLLLPKVGTYAPTATYYERTFGWRLGYANTEWEVLTG